MFPLIPALILLLLHGPANFEKLAESGRLPASLAVFQREAHSQPDFAKQDVSRRALATLIAASGNRELSQAFASMFMDGVVPPAEPVVVPSLEIESKPVFFAERSPETSDGYSRFVRSRDGPAPA